MRYIKVIDLEDMIVSAIKDAEVFTHTDSDFTAGYIDGLDKAHDLLLELHDNNYIEITEVNKKGN